jgi:hypothetical protein
MSLFNRARRCLVASLAVAAAALGGAGGALFGVCGPFSDVSDPVFCPFVLEIFTLGITNGTTPTTYDPASSVSRVQLAAFLSRTVDGLVKRGSPRASQGKFWNPQNASVLALTTMGVGPGGGPVLLRSDGTDVWATSTESGTVSRLRAGDGKLLETWTGAPLAYGIVMAMGLVVVSGETTPGALFTIDPTQPAGEVTTVASNLPTQPRGIAFDGSRVWTANGFGSISIVTPGSIPWAVTTVTTGFVSPVDVLYDGANIWATDFDGGKVLKLDSAGAILKSVNVANPMHAVFDGTNLWVPGITSATVTVLRASTGTVLRVLTGNGLAGPFAAAFDGERVLVTNQFGDSVSLWKAADLTPLGTFPMPAGSTVAGACTGGAYFWIALDYANKIARF